MITDLLKIEAWEKKLESSGFHVLPEENTDKY